MTRQQPHSWCSVQFPGKVTIQLAVSLFCVKLQHLYTCSVDFHKALTESVKIACGESLESLDSVKRWETHWRPSTSMQQEEWKSKWTLVRPDPTRNGVRQGCPLSPLLYLFPLFISDIPESLKEGGCTGVTLGTSQINSLLFADDLVIVSLEYTWSSWQTVSWEKLNVELDATN